MLLSIIEGLQVILVIGWAFVWYALLIGLSQVPILGITWWFPQHRDQGLQPGTWLYLAFHPVRALIAFMVVVCLWVPLFFGVMVAVMAPLDALYYRGLCPVFVDTRCQCLRAYKQERPNQARDVRIDCN